MGRFLSPPVYAPPQGVAGSATPYVVPAGKNFWGYVFGYGSGGAGPPAILGFGPLGAGPGGVIPTPTGETSGAVYGILYDSTNPAPIT